MPEAREPNGPQRPALRGRSQRPEPLAGAAPSSPSPRAVALVPARLASTRLERKMLRRDTGHWLFEHTVRNAERSAALSAVWLATDSEEIAAAAAEAGIPCVRTRSDHPSGTDRICEAARLLADEGSLEGVEVLINVQGDEPELPPEDLDHLVEAFADPDVEMATLWTPIERGTDWLAPHVVKLVCDAAGDAVYFSRAPIPARPPQATGTDAAPDPANGDAIAPPPGARRHVGVYAFRPGALQRFCELPPSPLELAESLEQLRWIEHGGKIRAVAASAAPRGIDTEQDYLEFASRWAARDAAAPLVRTGTVDPSRQGESSAR